MNTLDSNLRHNFTRNDDQNSLRFEANRLLTRLPPPESSLLSFENLLHELQVHQIELEMQNDQLSLSQNIIEESRDRFLELYESAPVGYLTLNRDGMIIEMNLTCASLLDVERNKAIHHRFATWVVNKDHWHRNFRLAKQAGGKQSFELQLKRGDGSVIYARMDCGYVEAGSESLIRIVLADITQQKRMEKEFLERQKEMADLHTMHVAAQTAAAIAHELNQPMLAITSYCDAAAMLMKKEKINFELLHKAVDGCKRQSLRAGHTIRELLELLKAKELPVETFDLNNEINTVLSEIKTEHELEFDHKILECERLPLVQANRTHFHKVISNLLHNAFDAMMDAGVVRPAITVIVRARLDENFAQVTVQDNGPGIKEEDLQRLFDPFFTTKDKGIGMGLAVSRALIEENGGNLWVDPQDTDQLWLYPQEMSGATFHLTLPLAS